MPLLPGMVMERGGTKVDEVRASGSPSKRGATDAQRKECEFMKLYPSSTPIYALWSGVDTDGDGFLSEAEVRTLCKRLNVRWQTQQLWHEAIRIAERNGKQLPAEWEDSCIDRSGGGAFGRRHANAGGCGRGGGVGNGGGGAGRITGGGCCCGG